ncbi:hypothetical protein [Bradyrhizobium elkanii]|uniref:Uncharacterized protein n=1 Tax=Bradyrhizobium elkanii TaxID=29448 RepID=A0ABV4F224_BRAEL|nr:hypothetical protein [Bradyrhizobium elkanii]MCS3881193.1 hypothetical protein [Bradyrhizobium elkanii]MCS4219754.1 hypothetical protein [Bradyrhizobium elkanii]WLB13830.1 hypothetical protein QIH87_23575 [Bradyrhizobium elkanii]
MKKVIAAFILGLVPFQAQAFIKYEPDLEPFKGRKVWVMNSGEEVQTDVEMSHFPRYCKWVGGTPVWEQKAANSYLLHCFRGDADNFVHFTAKGPRVDLDGGAKEGVKLKPVGLLGLTTDIQTNLPAMNEHNDKY